MVTIKVPATSANVGVGFDCLGIAFNLYTYFTFDEIDGFQISGCEERFSNQDNLVYTSFVYALKVLDKSVRGVHIHMDSHVPISRGLGSSATCVVAGVYGAFLLTNTTIDKDVILHICTQIEGHPDNVAPAIFGGLIASYQGEQVVYKRYPVAPQFHFLALIPNFETKTADARKVLPKQVAFADAVQNAARLSIVLKAFETYDTKALQMTMQDVLHEPYRKQLIHEYDAVKAICERVDSICFYISGSGSTLMNVMYDHAHKETIDQALKDLQYKWQSIVLSIDEEGACVC